MQELVPWHSLSHNVFVTLCNFISVIGVCMHVAGSCPVCKGHNATCVAAMCTITCICSQHYHHVAIMIAVQIYPLVNQTAQIPLTCCRQSHASYRFTEQSSAAMQYAASITTSHLLYGMFMSVLQAACWYSTLLEVNLWWPCGFLHITLVPTQYQRLYYCWVRGGLQHC